MILYVNGCSHTAAAEAVVPDCFAVDDGRYGIDRRPHPINLEASWGKQLSRMLNTEFYCDAESAARGRVMPSPSNTKRSTTHLS